MQVDRRRRRSRRRLRRHLLFAGSALVIGLVTDRLLNADDLPFRLSMATAYAALGFLAATLIVGPVRVLRGQSSPVHTFLRRDLGIWAGCLALAHVAAGLTVHFRGSMWKYFFSRPPSASAPFPLRHDAFGVASFTGLLSGVVLLLLLALSNNRSLAALGAERWKALQRTNYLAFALMAVHGVLFQLLETRAMPWAIAFLAAVAGVIALQAQGFVRRRRARRKAGS